MCFYQFTICFRKIVRHNFLFQGNQVPVDNRMLLLLRRKMYSRIFGNYFGWYGYCAFNVNGHLICAAESCCARLYFD